MIQLYQVRNKALPQGHSASGREVAGGAWDWGFMGKMATYDGGRKRGVVSGRRKQTHTLVGHHQVRKTFTFTYGIDIVVQWEKVREEGKSKREREGERGGQRQKNGR